MSRSQFALKMSAEPARVEGRGREEIIYLAKVCR